MLKTNGGLSTRELSELVGVSATAVRRHLNALEAEDLAFHRTEQRGMGRPSYIYQLASDASTVFNQSYAAFASSILEDLDGLNGEESPSELIDRRQKKRHQLYVKRTNGDSLSERVASLAQLMESEGRMTTWQRLSNDRFLLREHNCPFGELAQELDYPCRCELALLQQVLEAKVERIGHIPQGDISCVYQIIGRDNGHVASNGKSNGKSHGHTQVSGNGKSKNRRIEPEISPELESSLVG
jgi:predicted ArsR family transcriptional regulator